jgi:hypothetical protein
MFDYLFGAAFLRRRWLALPRCNWQVSLLCFAFVFGRACGALPPVPFLGPEPSDPYVRVPAASYQSVVGPYVSLRPTKPGNWKPQNESVAPQGGAPAHKH